MMTDETTSTTSPRKSLHLRVWEIVEAAHENDRVSQAFDITILTLITLSVITVILDSVHAIHIEYGAMFAGMEAASVFVFTIEYFARLWSCTSDPRFKHPVLGRLRFAVRFMPLIDLLAIVPFYLPLLGTELLSLRAMRLLRVLRLAKIGRYYPALSTIRSVFSAKREELVVIVVLMALLLVMSSTVLHYCESVVQPDVYSSIPAAMWWSVATLTTVGYGDIYPVTPMGKVCGSIIAILGVAMFALPTGVLGAGFVEVVQKKRQAAEFCPHCGKNISRRRRDEIDVPPKDKPEPANPAQESDTR